MIDYFTPSTLGVYTTPREPECIEAAVFTRKRRPLDGFRAWPPKRLWLIDLFNLPLWMGEGSFLYSVDSGKTRSITYYEPGWHGWFSLANKGQCLRENKHSGVMVILIPIFILIREDIILNYFQALVITIIIIIFFQERMMIFIQNFNMCL